MMDQKITYLVASPNAPSNLHEHKVPEFQELREVDINLGYMTELTLEDLCGLSLFSLNYPSPPGDTV